MFALLFQNIFDMILTKNTCQKEIYLMFFHWITSTAKNILPLRGNKLIFWNNSD